MAEDEEVVFTTSTGPVRVITAASLFDGHDAAINVMRRLIQSSGAEVIHLGHDQSAKAVVDCAIQEDAHAVALTSYQGGHVEYFTYIRELLDEAGCVFEMRQFVANLISESKCAVRWVCPGVLGSHSE